MRHRIWRVHFQAEGTKVLNKLKKRELCPIHHSYWCCNREKPLQRKKAPRGPVWRVEDIYHPRGWRELCTPAERRRRKHALMAQGKWDCIHCGKDVRFTPNGEHGSQYEDIELCHREACGMNGAKRDDSWENIGLGHKICNRENGSRPVA